MRQINTRFALRAFVAVLLLCSVSVHALSPPAGWTRTQSGAVETFAPVDLVPGETFTIAVHPAASTGGRPLNAWLDAWAVDKIPGTVSGKLVSEPGNNGQSATGQVTSRDARGRRPR